MPRFRLSKMLLLSLGLGLGLGAGAPSVDAKPRKTSAKKKPKAPPVKKVPPVSEEHKKKLNERMAGFKFGMSKDEVIGVFTKQLNERYEEKLKATTDVHAQDRLRRDKKTEIARVRKSYVTFERGKPSPWDVSIVEEEFAHDTDEAMMERWENQGGKNERRFFFFYQGKLWKMFISLDVSILPEDKKNFDTFQGVMQGQFGPGLVEPGMITWKTNDLQVRAIDKLKTYDMIGLALEAPAIKTELLALREAKRPPKKETSSIIKAVIDTDNKDHPDVQTNGGAVDAVIKAQGGGGRKK